MSKIIVSHGVKTFEIVLLVLSLTVFSLFVRAGIIVFTEKSPIYINGVEYNG